MSFGFFADAALTVPISDLQTTHKTDGSLDPVDTQVWLGSPDDTIQLVAASSPGVDPLILSITQLIPAWTASQAVTAGERRRATTSNNTVFEATNSGTTGASEPTWNTTIGATTADNGVTWEAVLAEDTPDEVRLATAQAGLAGATPGASLTLGAVIPGGEAGAVTFWVRRTDPDARAQQSTQLALALTTANEEPV